MSNKQENVLKELLEYIGRKIETWLLEPEGKTIMDLEYGAARVERVDCGANLERAFLFTLTFRASTWVKLTCSGR